MQRIVGVDTARGLAVLGMFVAHLGLERHVGLATPTGWFFLADGRPSALFAVLAGTGLAFMTRRAYPDDLAGMKVQRSRILKRSAVLFVLGWILIFLLTPVAVILPSYAVLFLLALPFLRMRPTAVLAWAGAATLVMPQVVLLGRQAVYGDVEPRFDVPPVAELFSGYYPALSWTAYLLVGLAVGRLRLTSTSVQAGLLGAGVAAAAVGYGAGALLQGTGALPHYLVSTEPHAGTTVEMLGNTGTAVALLGLCLLLTTRVAPVRVLLTPVSATGAMSLTVYSLHIVYIAILGSDAVWNPQSNRPLIWLVLGTFVFATLWQATLGRGPLERAVNALIAPRTPPPAWPPGAPQRRHGPGAPPVQQWGTAGQPAPAPGQWGAPGQPPGQWGAPGQPPAAPPWGAAQPPVPWPAPGHPTATPAAPPEPDAYPAAPPPR